MAIKDVNYSKTFISKTEYANLGTSESPRTRYFQNISDEDRNFREKVIQKFGHFGVVDLMRDNFGSDGKQIYTFGFNGIPSPIESDQNNEYASVVNIRKSGEENFLDDFCDLELFLVREGFQKS